MLEKLKKLFPDQAESTYKELQKIIKDFKKKNPVQVKRSLFSEKDIILICYADHLREPGVKTLQTMHKFLTKYVRGAINKIHFLPFCPWSSDDGFSVKNYYQVDKTYGDWQDLENIREKFDLMFDCVANHVSVQNEWFQKFLAGDEKYKDYFIAFSEEDYEKNKDNFSKVFRPRKHSLLTPFQTVPGKKYVWTTFSEDQVDLNFSNPEVLLEIIKIILFYVAQGATAIRLDAFAYAWKKLGTNCFDLPEAHILVQIIREVLAEAAPQVWLITETVLPHKQNISYFGDGKNEAHLVYHFQLETLLLHTMLSGNTEAVTKWLQTVKPASADTSYLNLSVSHDGIHIIPAEEILSAEQIKVLADKCGARGGEVLERDAGGKTAIYEINITYPSAIGEVDKYLASQAIQLALQGVPLIYFNNLIGIDNWTEGLKKGCDGRAINREKFDYKELTQRLEDKNSRKYKIYNGYKRLLKTRISEPLFSPLVEQKILNLGPELMAILRYRGNTDNLLALTNVTNREIRLDVDVLKREIQKEQVDDILTGMEIKLDGNLVLKPYEVKWLK